MFDVSCLNNAPSNICDLFTKANSKHTYETSFSSSGNCYGKTESKSRFFSARIGAKLWNAIPNEISSTLKMIF